MVNIIVAVGERYGIGKNGYVPWRCPEDLKFFKEMTLGKTVIMGRVTHESIGHDLPGRKNIVVSRKGESLENAISVNSDAFIIGGEEVYKEALTSFKINRIYISYIDAEVEDYDRFFPMELVKAQYTLLEKIEKETFYVEVWG